MNETHEKIHRLNEQAWLERNKDVQKSLEMAQQVEILLGDLGDTNPREFVLSLRTQGYCLEHLSRYGEALSIAMRAKKLASQLADLRLVASIDNTLGSIYWRLADFSSSLDHFMQGLRLVQIEPDPELEVFLLQGLGILHHDLAEYEEALEYFKRSLESALPEDIIGRAFALNNIAYTLHEMKHDRQALPYALESLEFYDRESYSVGRLEVLHTLGSIYLELGDLDRSSRHFQEGVQAAQAHENPLQVINALFGVCQVHQIQGEVAEALQKLLWILQMSQSIGSLASQCTAHEHLAKLYKQLGQFQAALHHHEIFHAIHVQIFNEQAERRLHNTQLLLEVETIQKEANLYRTLAATDSLTGLLSRRELFELGEKFVRQARAQHVPVSLLMVDVDYFKPINDQYGHAIGDEVLAIVARRLKKTLREADLAGRYGGDEFVILMPEISLSDCQGIAERCRKAIVEEPVDVGMIKLSISISIGLTVQEVDQALSLEHLVQRADRALLDAKKNGRNRIVTAAPNF